MGTSFLLDLLKLASHIRGRSQVRYYYSTVHRGKCMALWMSTRLDRGWLHCCHCMHLERRRPGWGTRFGATDADLHAGQIELGSAECHCYVGYDPRLVVSWSYLGRERHRGGLAVHCTSYFHVLIRRVTRLERRMIRTDVLLVPSFPVRLFANLVDSEPLGPLNH